MTPGLYIATPGTGTYELLVKACNVDKTVDLTAINLAAKVRKRCLGVLGK